ncbi:MAG: hypothetical protein GC134_06110 [Proteobacteria bacterium]|nr:hypothetical protein [Pseudomonadota bacterium]
MPAKLAYYLHRLKELPAQEIARVAVRKANHLVANRHKQAHDLLRGTFALEHTPAFTGLQTLLTASKPPRMDEALHRLCRKFAGHSFNLLGSGWIEQRYGMRCRGRDGNTYTMGADVVADATGDWLAAYVPASMLAESRRRWRLIKGGYTPIDWQLDFISGYRWSSKLPSSAITFGNKPGADVKVPWELARMQHLPLMALSHLDSPDVGLVHAIRNQIIDFAATNPPRFGVNWVCTMDVAIRAANIALAATLIEKSGHEWDAPFRTLLGTVLYEHARHTATHYEWHHTLRGNHYLADVCGQLFTLCALERTPQTDAWFALAVQEFVGELPLQFLPDGANFEASSAYHRLSSEMAAYATALLTGLSSERKQALQSYDWTKAKGNPPLAPAPQSADLDNELLERLEKTAEFSLHMTRPDGVLWQVGDNDSGRFFNVQPAVHADTLIEDGLDHHHLWGAIGSLFGREDLRSAAGSFKTDGWLVEALSAGICLLSYRRPGAAVAAHVCTIGQDFEFDLWKARVAELPDRQKLSQSFKIDEKVGNLNLYAYPDFGAYIWRGKETFIGLRAGPNGQAGNGGHAHNDHLALELMTKTGPVFQDPGTFIYTALPEVRNRYRSVRVHHAPKAGTAEPCPFEYGTFRLPDRALAGCMYFGTRGFVGTHQGYGQPIYRMVELSGKDLTVTDFVLENDGITPTDPTPEPIAYSPGYGIREKA